MKAVNNKDNQLDLLHAILRKIKSGGPEVRQLVLKTVTNETKTASQFEISGEIIRRLKIQNKKLLEQVSSLREQLVKRTRDRNTMLARMNSIEKLNNSLALALGSCERCWGDDAACVHCHGNGSSGWKKINRRLYNMYVLPMLERKYGLNRKIK